MQIFVNGFLCFSFLLTLQVPRGGSLVDLIYLVLVIFRKGQVTFSVSLGILADCISVCSNVYCLFSQEKRQSLDTYQLTSSPICLKVNEYLQWFW